MPKTPRSRVWSCDAVSTHAVHMRDVAGEGRPERELLAALSRELIGLGLGAGLRDAHPEAATLAVHTGAPGDVLWIAISRSGTHFIWNLADHRHPVNDVPGAARHIAAYLGRYQLPEARGA